MVHLFFGLVALFFLSFFFFYYLKKLFFNNYFLLFILTTFLFYFILFYFTLFNFIFFVLAFFLFLPFILSRVDGRLLVLQLGVRAGPQRWESQVQDTGPQETSQLHIITYGENLPEISTSMPRPSSTQRPASYSAGHPMPNN